MPMTPRFVSMLCGLALLSAASPLVAQVPVDAVSDRRLGDYVFFQPFGTPKVPFDDLEAITSVRENSAAFFDSKLATCQIAKPTCDPDAVYELADRFCQSLEFHEAATWRLSQSAGELVLHWAICGLKK
ncbi:MAG: hypothetical protein AAGG72_04460 [Pseudomonadota bacterium]